MDTSISLFDTIKIISLIIGATFGIIAAATNTKNQTGNLTKWGKGAIIAIILTTCINVMSEYFASKQNVIKKMHDGWEVQQSEERDSSIIRNTEQIIIQQKELQKSMDEMLENK